MSVCAPPPTQEVINASAISANAGNRELDEILAELEATYPECKDDIQNIKKRKDSVVKSIPKKTRKSRKRKAESEDNGGESVTTSTKSSREPSPAPVPEQNQKIKKPRKKTQKDMPDFNVVASPAEKNDKVIIKTLNLNSGGFMEKLKSLKTGTTAFLTGAFVDGHAKISTGSHTVMQQIGAFMGDMGSRVNLVLHIGTKSNKISWTDLLSNETTRTQFLKGVNDNVQKFGIRSVAIDLADGLSDNPSRDVLNIVLQKIGSTMFIPITANEIKTKSTECIRSAGTYDENKLKFFIPDATSKNIDDLVHSEFEAARGKQTYVLVKTSADMHDSNGEFVHSYPRNCILKNKHISVDGEHVSIKSRNYKGKIPTRKGVKDLCKHVKKSGFAGVIIGDRDDDVNDEKSALESAVVF